MVQRQYFHPLFFIYFCSSLNVRMHANLYGPIRRYSWRKCLNDTVIFCLFHRRNRKLLLSLNSDFILITYDDREVVCVASGPVCARIVLAAKAHSRPQSPRAQPPAVKRARRLWGREWRKPRDFKKPFPHSPRGFAAVSPSFRAFVGMGKNKKFVQAKMPGKKIHANQN